MCDAHKGQTLDDGYCAVPAVQAVCNVQKGQTLITQIGTKIEKCMVYWGCLQLVNAALAFRDFQIYLENFGVLLSKKAIMF